MSGNRAVVAMSGGVDSSVAALLLHRDGYDCLGISMQVWDYRSNGGCQSRATCCSPDDFTDARKVAAKIGIPYYVFDFEASFREKVINKFVESYENGLTPNPCVDCNTKVKFHELRERAAGFECDFVATGHYARIEEHNGELQLLRGNDREKDQSYFLYGITRDQLRKTLFPVGHLNKREVREIAKDAELATADKSESQDICFVSGRVQDFLVTLNGGKGKRSETGKIVKRGGEVVGTHRGVQNFTVGQRKGLQLGGSAAPQYVLELEPETNTVVVGEKSDLERESFAVEELSWLVEAPSVNGPLDCMVQVRHRHAGVGATLTVSEDGKVTVKFKDTPAVVSPGQAAVFYDLKNERVLGGGRISRFGH